MKRTLRSTLLAAALLTVTVLGGCSSSITSHDLRRDWTPELDSTALSFEEYYNERTIRRDNYKRQILDDWANIWLEGRNLRLTRYTLP